jgi:putative FmdB family regulatory protein
MPLYEFHCRECDRELILVLTEQDYFRKAYRCPRCRGRNLELIPDPAGVPAGKSEVTAR